MLKLVRFHAKEVKNRYTPRDVCVVRETRANPNTPWRKHGASHDCAEGRRLDAQRESLHAISRRHVPPMGVHGLVIRRKIS